MTVLLKGLPAEFKVVVSFVSLSLTPLSFQRLVDALVECESWQLQAIQEVVYVVILVEDSSTMSRPQAYAPSSFGHNRGPNVSGVNNGLNGGFGPTHGGLNGGFGPPYGNRSSAPSMDNDPVSNNVQVNSSTAFRPQGQPLSGVAVPWHIKLRASVLDPYIGLPRLRDIYASDYFDLSISSSHINSAQCGLSGDGTDSHVPGPVGTTSWYLDSSANNHVYRDFFTLRDVVSYSVGEAASSQSLGTHHINMVWQQSPAITTVPSSLSRSGFIEKPLGYGRILKLPTCKKYPHGRKLKFFDFRAQASACAVLLSGNARFESNSFPLSDIVAEIWFILHYCFSSLFIPPDMYLLPYDHYHTFLLLETTKISSETAGTISNKTDSKDEDLAFVAGATGRVGSRTVRELLKLGFRVRAGVRSAQKAETLVQSVKQLKLDPEGTTRKDKRA
ncbi:hypothetical protein Gotur_006527 [Gossypium turneri]